MERCDWKWLDYSKYVDKIYCFCCKLFKSTNKKDSITNDGFNDCKHLIERLKEHEKSIEYSICMSFWNEVRVKLNKNLQNHDDLQQKL